MRVIKKINNNAAICLDDNGHEMVAFGTGIGFPKTPYELNDLTKIKRTYYGINKQYIGLLTEIPQKIFELSAQIMDYAISLIDVNFSPNTVFTLGDHINFAIERYKNKIEIPMPELGNLAYLYPKEFKVGKYGIRLINKEMKVQLNQDEVTGIALNIINAEIDRKTDKSGQFSDTEIIKACVKIVESFYQIRISQESFNYKRFVTHLQYLIERLKTGEETKSENSDLLSTLKIQYPNTYQCALQIKKKIDQMTNSVLPNEELVYLMLHINRLRARELDNNK